MVRTCAVMLICLALAPDAAAQGAREFRALADQLARIERDLRDLERQVYARQSGPQARPDAFIDPNTDLSRIDDVDGRFLERLGGLEQEVRGLTAQVEQSLFRVEQLERRMEAMAEDLAFALQGGASGANGVAAGAQDAMAGSLTEQDREAGAVATRAPVTTPARTRIAGSDAAPFSAAASGASSDATDGAGFDAAKAMLLQGDLVGAQSAFTDFIDANPDDPRTPEARYWLGEAMFAAGDHEAAARAFLEAVRADAQGGRAPESYLKLGMALGALGETKEACDVFSDLPKRFENASSGLLRRVEVARDEVGCP